MMKIIRSGSNTSEVGSANCFASNVKLELLFRAEVLGRTPGAQLDCKSGGWTDWHKLPAFQSKVVMCERGRGQRKSGLMEERLV